MTSPDDPIPDSAMASGSDAGEPGEHLGPADLTDDERRVLEELERDAPASREDDDVADNAVVRAAEDEAPLPGEGGDQGDGLSARFSSPPGEDED
ncbi:hypothetical protein SAMN05660350_00099 [Geodermatophilus obscurus]|uniref:DUF5709 domain-containing protein n=1 Tax=Geodermatophilus obscurus TaxID=1861 RepID=A0A1M7RTH3_9ACTN|nr:hypothetical protein [Geodermatophilus obscurus]SHN49613.1 hypothetical protein SAMN05660350_00099 [Geodermatophilus obscurus]